MNIVLLSIPLHRTGGIASWSQKYYNSYSNSDIQLRAVDNAPNREDGAGFLKRIISGLSAARRVMKEIRSQCDKEKIDIIHTTTSGNIGSYRDILIGRFCKKKGIKSILHCHYGNIVDVLQSKGLIAKLVIRALKYYDQIWVLDKRSQEYLKSLDEIKGEIKLTPNSIHVSDKINLSPKKYKEIAFIGNLIPEKGLYELIKAVKSVKYDVRLHIVGCGTSVVEETIKRIAGDKLGQTINMYGRLSNAEAVSFMQTIDILALPSYMGAEAFPISILEAMSLGKLVISTKRAAIQDILTAEDGTPCGIFVRERNIEDISNAINWCIEHPLKADELCGKAYKKVYNSYRTNVIYDLYTACYKELL